MKKSGCKVQNVFLWYDIEIVSYNSLRRKLVNEIIYQKSSRIKI